VPVGRNPNRARVLQQCLVDCTSDPPLGIADESESASFVELFSYGYKSNVSGTYQVLQCNTIPLMLCREVNHEAEICHNQLISRLSISPSRVLRVKSPYSSVERGMDPPMSLELRPNSLFSAHFDLLLI